MCAAVIEIPAEREGEALSVLAAAFHADPLMGYLYDDEAPGYRARLRAVFAYQAAVFRREGWPLLGLQPRTRLAAVLALRPPEPPRHTEAMAEPYEALVERLGAEAAERMERYALLPGRHLPAEPVFYVAMIGVRPGAQGQGYARRLLDEAHRRAADHPRAAGVALDTENPDNLAIYERLGYRQLGRAELAPGLGVWCMFRPNPRSNAA